MSHSVSFHDVNITYIVTHKAVARLQRSKQLTRITMIAHKTEEHVKSASLAMSRNNRRAVGSGVLYAFHAVAM
jgi:hypothetical protein